MRTRTAAHCESMDRVFLRFAQVLMLISIYGCGKGDKPSVSVTPVKSEKAKAPDLEDKIDLSKPVNYWLRIGSYSGPDAYDEAKSEFDDDKTVSLSGSPLGGTIVPYVNGSPVSICASGTLINITFWLWKGPNKVTLKGEHSNPVYFKVIANRPSPDSAVEFNAWDFEDVQCKAFLDVDTESQSASFTSERTGLFQQRSDVLTNSLGKVNGKIQRQLTAEISKIRDQWVAKDLTGIKDFRLRVFRHPALRDELQDYEELNDTADVWKGIADVLDDDRYSVATQMDDLKFVWGQRSVAVYAGVQNIPLDHSHGEALTTIDRPYLFLVTPESEGWSQFVNRFVAFRVNGQWVVW